MIIQLCITNKTFYQTMDFVNKLAESKFKTYSATNSNWQQFANKLANFLCDKNIHTEVTKRSTFLSILISLPLSNYFIEVVEILIICLGIIITKFFIVNRLNHNVHMDFAYGYTVCIFEKYEWICVCAFVLHKMLCNTSIFEH